jgi:hypothetical protein
MLSKRTRSPRLNALAWFALALGVALLIPLAAAPVAVAQPRPTAVNENLANAEALFQAGKAAMARKDYATACKAFEDSVNLDDSLGTRLNLARCNEDRGRVSTAWGQYRDVEVRALKAGPSQESRATEATERAALLEPRLSRVTILVLPSVRTLVGEVTVSIDGRPASEVLWMEGVPVDVGTHELVASAPGKLPFVTKFRVEDEGKNSFVQVLGFYDAPPELAKPVPKAAPNAQDVLADVEQAAKQRTERTLGYVIGGVGLATTLAGLACGGIALAAVSDANRCTAERPCLRPGRDYTGPVPGGTSDADYQTSNDARSRVGSFGTAANVLVPVGLVVTAVGVFFLSRSLGAAPKAKTSALRVTPNGIEF